MSYRGKGRGRGSGSYGRSYAKQEPFERFPVIEGFGTAEYSDSKIQLIKWSMAVHKYWTNSSPYYYEDGRQRRLKKAQKTDIERYSDRKSQTTKFKSQLEDFMMLDPDYIPAELAEGGKKRKRAAKKIRWNPELGHDIFEKFEKMEGEGEKTENKENEDEEEEDEENEEKDEFSDEGDYEQNEDFDDDDDDFNMVDDNDEAIY